MSDAKVTFVMPSIRHEFFDDAVRGILHQSIGDWELLIYNGKKDRGLNFDDSRVHVINCDWNVSKCINHAMENATSNIMCLNNDDDISLPDRARLTYEYIQEGADLFYTSYLGINHYGRPAQTYLALDFDFEEFRLSHNNVPVISGGWRIDKAPKWREDVIVLNDFCFLMDYYKLGGKFVKSLTPTTFFRIWRGGMSYDSINKKRDETYYVRNLYNDQELRSKRKTVWYTYEEPKVKQLMVDDWTTEEKDPKCEALLSDTVK